VTSDISHTDGNAFLRDLELLDALDNELDVFGLDCLSACMSSKGRGLFADANGVFFQDVAHFLDGVVPYALGAGFLDESPNGRRRKFTVSHQNNQKKVWNRRFY